MRSDFYALPYAAQQAIRLETLRAELEARDGEVERLREALKEARSFMLRHTDRGAGSGLQYSAAHLAKIDALNAIITKIDAALSRNQGGGR